MTPFSAKSTCVESARARSEHPKCKSPFADCCALTQQRMRGLFIERTENTRTLVAVLLPSAQEPASVVSGSYYILLLLGCRFIPHAGVRIYIRLEGLASSLLFVCCLCLLVAHTMKFNIVERG